MFSGNYIRILPIGSGTLCSNPHNMSNTRIKLPIGCLGFLIIPMFLFGQAGPQPGSTTGKTAGKLDKSKVPRIVTEMFNKQYPVKRFVNWYGYPQFDNGSSWYEYDPSYYSKNNPENYVVEFTHNDTLDKVFYTKTGKKIAIHRNMSAALPDKITHAIRTSIYKTWEIGGDKEEIFKDNKTDRITVYRVTMREGSKRHTLYFRKNGKLLRIINSA
jgi:hypothetical protein